MQTPKNSQSFRYSSSRNTQIKLRKSEIREEFEKLKSFSQQKGTNQLESLIQKAEIAFVPSNINVFCVPPDDS